MNSFIWRMHHCSSLLLRCWLCSISALPGTIMASLYTLFLCTKTSLGQSGLSLFSVDWHTEDVIAILKPSNTLSVRDRPTHLGSSTPSQLPPKQREEKGRLVTRFGIIFSHRNIYIPMSIILQELIFCRIFQTTEHTKHRVSSGAYCAGTYRLKIELGTRCFVSIHQSFRSGSAGLGVNMSRYLWFITFEFLSIQSLSLESVPRCPGCWVTAVSRSETLQEPHTRTFLQTFSATPRIAATPSQLLSWSLPDTEYLKACNMNVLSTVNIVCCWWPLLENIHGLY